MYNTHDWPVSTISSLLYTSPMTKMSLVLELTTSCKWNFCTHLYQMTVISSDVPLILSLHMHRLEWHYHKNAEGALYKNTATLLYLITKLSQISRISLTASIGVCITVRMLSTFLHSNAANNTHWPINFMNMPVNHDSKVTDRSMQRPIMKTALLAV